MSVTGNWKLTMATPFGVQTPTLSIKQEGASHSGTLSGKAGEASLDELKVDGESLSFSSIAKTPMGDFPVSYRASVSGDNMNGTFKTMMGETPFTGVRE